MEIGLICPVKHIEMTSLLPGRFCIAPVAAEFIDYLMYFKKSAEEGYKVILDNGTFEGKTLERVPYLELADEIGASIVVAPDTIGMDALLNYKQALEFAKSKDWMDFKKAAPVGDPPPELMFVPQCAPGITHDFESVMRHLLADKYFRWIGICRDAVYNAYGKFTNTTEQELNRFYFCARMEEQGLIHTLLDAGKKFHFLGVGQNLFMLQYYWFVDSMDTASLFYLPACGYTPAGGRYEKTLRRPSDYFRHDFKNSDFWSVSLEQTCIQVQEYADMARELRRQKLGGKL